MTSFTIFGTGTMGHAIGGVLARGGASTQYIGTGDAGAQVSGDIIVLAVPYASLKQVVERYGEEFDGRTVIDVTNPVNFSTFDALEVPAGSSAAAELQEALPGARVLKAFNTNFAGTLVSGVVGGLKTTVLVAGNHTESKITLIKVIEAAGLEALDAGTLSRAHELEAVGLLTMSLAISKKVSWDAGFVLTH